MGDDSQEEKPKPSIKQESVIEAANALKSLGDEEENSKPALEEPTTKECKTIEESASGPPHAPPMLMLLNEDTGSKRFLPEHKKPDAALTFPEKLMKMMRYVEKEGEDREDYCVAWLPDGKSFIVRNPDIFTRTIVPLFFKPTKFSSFTRKLYRWGFRQVNRGIGPDDPVVFGNDFFSRHNEELICKMRSITAAGTRKAEQSSVSSQQHMAKRGAYDMYNGENNMMMGNMDKRAMIYDPRIGNGMMMHPAAAANMGMYPPHHMQPQMRANMMGGGVADMSMMQGAPPGNPQQQQQMQQQHFLQQQFLQQQQMMMQAHHQQQQGGTFLHPMVGMGGHMGPPNHSQVSLHMNQGTANQHQHSPNLLQQQDQISNINNAFPSGVGADATLSVDVNGMNNAILDSSNSNKNNGQYNASQQSTAEIVNAAIAALRYAN